MIFQDKVENLDTDDVNKNGGSNCQNHRINNDNSCSDGCIFRGNIRNFLNDRKDEDRIIVISQFIKQR